jgi:hypothetical protein
MTVTQDPIVRKTVSLPESLWRKLGDYRFYHRFPTETAAVVDVVGRGLSAAAVLGAIADIATGRRRGNGKFLAAAARTMGDASGVFDLVVDEVRNRIGARGLTLTEAQIQDKAREVYDAAGRLAGGQASHGQAAILDVAIEYLIEWSLREAGVDKMMVTQFRIESESEADEYLRDLLSKPEYQSMNEVEIRKQRHITDPTLKIYFMDKAKEMLRAYGHEIK